MPKLISVEKLKNLLCHRRTYLSYEEVKQVIDLMEQMPDETPESEWILTTYTNGFGTFKALRCEKCGAKRNQVDLRYCAHCGAKMANAEEIGGEKE